MIPPLFSTLSKYIDPKRSRFLLKEIAKGLTIEYARNLICLQAIRRTYFISRPHTLEIPQRVYIGNIETGVLIHITFNAYGISVVIEYTNELLNDIEDKFNVSRQSLLEGIPNPFFDFKGRLWEWELRDESPAAWPFEMENS